MLQPPFYHLNSSICFIKGPDMLYSKQGIDIGPEVVKALPEL